MPSAVDSGLQFVSAVASSDLVIAGPPGMPKGIANMLSNALQKSLEDEDLIAWSKRVDRPFYWLNPDRVAEIVKDGFPVYEKYKDFLK